ncbi:MAG: hypothetical protein EOS73_29035 [Mesorhizobium sp.]|uniref:hypothetical protein n=1 Tax=Mesorhizobium sp. M7A.F.Ca.ET.027.02.1.1 TaxID=2496655 RepID=UPI000FD466FA|nr:hypothetical protein [Mesorhizobium sp. M7A.F.Ca.ET.027.02.1.1]RVD14676.1 hypothetical protein EN749_18805 [Mesorhizobium sp. M7A.F.Ca.ET.027.02.1.1]RWC99063.1 MAG: hypothetical protein EOS73_29035 [Mesorhizobium sp.]
MGWREDLIVKYERDIASMKQSIQWMRDGIEKIGEAGEAEFGNLNADVTAHYERTIIALEDAVRRLRAGEV